MILWMNPANGTYGLRMQDGFSATGATAPAGTRIRSVGDGVVEFAGRQGGYGNMVILRHDSSHSTA